MDLDAAGRLAANVGISDADGRQRPIVCIAGRMVC